QPFQVGDRITFGSHYGEVKEIGLRMVRIVTLDDNLISIPTNKFLTEEVASGNAGALDMMVVIDFLIAIDADFEEAKRIVYEATVTSKYVYLNKPVAVLLSDQVVGMGVATQVRVKAYVVDTRFEKRFASDVTERVKHAFRKAGIRPPVLTTRRDELAA
ncbi:MAG: mechanosensitive ion channel, partial [Myxococcales bacterium]|nr:mechanosensitive ion channel [Myxococcales bacterium]